MGWALSWIAVQAEPDAALELLGLRRTGEKGLYGEVPFAANAFSNGWYVVVADGCDGPLLSRAALARASAEVTVVACSIEEHVMASWASLWSEGQEVWRIAHEAERGHLDIEVRGAMPEFFEELKDDILSEQGAEDSGAGEVDWVFDLPLRAAHRLTGFKHDDPHTPYEFEVLEPAPQSAPPPAPGKPWWKVWS
ncbi:MAG TPA: hypothetical protein VMR86_12600 [Myxococcota bacterium]|nr:hypothetical protein [Myxococcota bacterium]